MPATDPAGPSGSAAFPEVLPKLRRFGDHVGLIRPLHRGDEPLLQEFFASHSADTIYERYGSMIASMSADRASLLVNVDQSKDCALGIFEPWPEGEILHAVGRYCLDPDGTSAELAFVVRETMRHLGMAATLLEMLMQAARDRGLTGLWAQASAQNQAMLGIFRRHGFALAADLEAGVVRATLVLGAPPVGKNRRRMPVTSSQPIRGN